VSWDGKALLVLTMIWAGIALVYATVIDMVTGARAWGAGAALFAVLTLGIWYAELRGARRRKKG
jgi:Flp pilus assembly protein TadB